jgi:hypothetical protein
MGHVIVEIRIVLIHVGLFIFPTFITVNVIGLTVFVNSNRLVALGALGVGVAHLPTPHELLNS